MSAERSSQEHNAEPARSVGFLRLVQDTLKLQTRLGWVPALGDRTRISYSTLQPLRGVR